MNFVEKDCIIHCLILWLARGISGATAVNAVGGFGRRGSSTLHIEGISLNYPLIIEVVDRQSKLEPLLPQIKRMINDNGLITVQELYAICLLLTMISRDSKVLESSGLYWQEISLAYSLIFENFCDWLVCYTGPCDIVVVV